MLSDRLDETLEDADRRRVDRHVRLCRRCKRVLGNLRATVEQLTRLQGPESADDEAAIERIRRSWRDHRDDARIE